MAQECTISTIDNPYSPYDNFTDWLMYDNEHGYNSCQYLARIANLTDDMTDAEANAEIERAIDEIIKYNPLGIYIKVFKDKNNNFKNFENSLIE